MKIRLQIDAGGIFSKYMFLIQNAHHLNKTQVYAECIDPRATKNGNPFDFVLDQSSNDELSSIYAIHCGNYSESNKIEYSPNYLWYKNFVHNFLKIKQEIMVDSASRKLYSDYIGVHIRLTDMNSVHPEYGQKKLEDYFSIIDSLPLKPLFLASDNTESIYRMLDRYGDRCFYNKDFIRLDNENDETTSVQLDNLSNSIFWKEAFIEMLMLSMSSELVFRNSNLANAAIIHAKYEQKLHRI